MKDTLSPRALSITTWAEVMAYVSELESQRDALAVALRELVTAVETPDADSLMQIAKARAVLAKVTV